MRKSKRRVNIEERVQKRVDAEMQKHLRAFLEFVRLEFGQDFYVQLLTAMNRKGGTPGNVPRAIQPDPNAMAKVRHDKALASIAGERATRA